MSLLSIRPEPHPDAPSEPPPPSAPAPLITLSIIAINTVVFAAMVVSGVPFLHPNAQQVLPWGANFGPLTTGGQWWRLLAACFLHFGIVHIGLNMIVLFQVGIFTERLYGRLRFLTLYLLTGIAGNIAGLYFHPVTVGAGASGAVFGVYGALLAFLLIKRGVVPAERAVPMAWSAGFFLLYNFLYALKDLQTDLVAHAAGLLTGFAVGALLSWSLSALNQRILTLRTAVSALIILAAAATSIARVPKHSASYNDWFLRITTAPSVTVGANDRLVYTSPITRTDAQAAAQKLIRLGIFRAPNVTALLERGPAGTSFSLPLTGDETLPKSIDTLSSKLVDGKVVTFHQQEALPPPPWDNPVFLTSLHSLGPQLATALGGPPLSIRLLNRKGELMKEVPIDSAAITIGARDVVTYSGKSTQQEAKALGAELQSIGFFKDRGTQVDLARDTAGPTITFYMRQTDWADPRVIQGYQLLGRKLAPAVGGLPLTLRLADNASLATRNLIIQ